MYPESGPGHHRPFREVSQNQTTENNPTTALAPTQNGIRINRNMAVIAPNFPPRNPQLPPTHEAPLRLRGRPIPVYTEDDWMKEKYIDCILEVGTPMVRIPGHRIVLEASPVLKKHFRYRTPRDTLRMPNLNPSGTIDVIRWLYTGELDIPETCLIKVKHIINAAALLGLKPHLNFWAIRKEGVIQKKEKLVNYINGMILDNYGPITTGVLFNGFDPEDVKEIVRIGSKQVPVVEIFNSIIRWGQGESKRTNNVEEILQLIQIEAVYEECPQVFIQAFRTPDSLIYQNLKCEEFKQKVDKLLHHYYDKAPASGSRVADPNEPSTSSSTLSSNLKSTSTAAPTFENEDDAPFICYAKESPFRNFESGKPIMVKTEPMEGVSSYTPVPKRARIEIEEESKVRKMLIYPITIVGTTYLDVYDFETDQTRRIHRGTTQKRDYSSLVCSGNNIFDLGGTTDEPSSIWDDINSTKVVEKFKKGVFNGFPGPAMRKALRVFGACCHKDIIYVTGGDCTSKDGTMVSSSLQTLNLRDTNMKWQMKKPMFDQRSCHDMAVLGDDIYVVGGVGSDNDSSMRKAERYSTVYETWTKLPALTTGRRCLRVVAYQGKILAIGGEITVPASKEYRFLSSIEAFDPQTGKWEFFAPLRHGRKSFGVVVVDRLIYVVGGNSDNISEFNIEVFNGEEWKVLPWPDKLNQHGKFISSSVIDANYIDIPQDQIV